MSDPDSRAWSYMALAITVAAAVYLGGVLYILEHFAAKFW